VAVKCDPGTGVTRSAGAPGYEWPRGRVVLVTGGSQGARGINEALLRSFESATGWPQDVAVVWVSGPAHSDSIGERAGATRWASRIDVVPYIEDLGPQLNHVTLAIARAGAMSLAEVTAAGVPSILVPLPTSAAGHQLANARALAEAGAAVVREEADLTDADLWSVAVELLDDPKRLASMAAAARERGAPGAADRIAADLLRLARGEHSVRTDAEVTDDG
jgi:UDP-N-acetylglucosamine--N-acetylmuramyl-(pentapeptide) pyrophosphoryl-undecaprenol N-acetylglucosamine transferase